MAKERGLWTASKKESRNLLGVESVSFCSEYVKLRQEILLDQQTGPMSVDMTAQFSIHSVSVMGLNVGGGLPLLCCGYDMAKRFMSPQLIMKSLYEKNLDWRIFID